MRKYFDLVAKIFHPRWVLTTVFLVLLTLEIYLLYSRVYKNLYTPIEDAPIEQNVVRLDVINYNKMLELLDSLKVYTGREINIENPFD
jgi:hypothetical protein